MYCGYITTIKEIRKHSNADRLQCATIFGSNVIVDLTYHEGQRVVYFPIDGQLSEEFCEDNNLVRKKDENGNEIGGYMDPVKRNIKAIRLRGEMSDGLVLPIEVLDKYTDSTKLCDGDQITVLDGHEICKKYVPKRNPPKTSGGKKQKKKAKAVEFPLFFEHSDTAQLMYNQNAFKPGDVCYITLKIHGTSARTSNTIKVTEKQPNRIAKFFGIKPKQIKEYDYVSGTRRVVLDNFEGGYYGNDEFRKVYHEFLKNKLPKMVTLYYEIAGYVNKDTPIMGRVSNKKVNDKEFRRIYGDETVFSYGCEPGENDIWAYRMTITNEDGFVVEIPYEQMQIECEKMGVKVVPLFEKFIFTTWEDLMERVEKYYDGPDPIDPRHVREGVVVRIANSTKGFEAYKHKNDSFKILSGIIKDSVNADEASADILEEL